MNALAGLRSLFRGVLLARPMTGVMLARPMTAPSPFDFLFGAQWRGLKTYKLKTHKGAAKRLFPVGNGKTVKHERAGKQHLNTKMSGAAKQDSSLRAYVHVADMPNVRRMLPYGKKFRK